MSATPTQHLSAAEVELWAEGLLPAARALHLADCPACLASAERERTFYVELVNLERFGPQAGFDDRVMARVRVVEGVGHKPTA